MLNHYVCTSCKNSLPEIGVCEQEGCTSQWEMLESCTCSDGSHGAEDAGVPTKDAHGTILHTGDSVVLIKDLPLRGTSQKFKQGTKVTVTLRDNTEEVDCKINGQAIVLKTEFLKKV